MAFTVEVECESGAIGLEEYLDYVRNEVELHDIDSIRESAPMFRRLMANRGLLTSHLNKELSQWREFQMLNEYAGPVLLLESNDDFIVRANVWAPPAQYSNGLSNNDAVYSYLQPHSHDFSFLTGGYFGSGYETTIYEWTPGRETCIPGSIIDLRFLETTTLPAGKIMMYRAHEDVHVQQHPSEFSISLNLIARPDGRSLRQYQFDFERSIITDYLPTGVAAQEVIYLMAALLGNGRSAELLEDIAFVHRDNQIRGRALHALSVLDGRRSEECWELASRGGQKVREVFEALCERLPLLSPTL